MPVNLVYAIEVGVETSPGSAEVHGRNDPALFRRGRGTAVIDPGAVVF